MIVCIFGKLGRFKWLLYPQVCFHVRTWCLIDVYICTCLESSWLGGKGKEKEGGARRGREWRGRGSVCVWERERGRVGWGRENGMCADKEILRERKALLLAVGTKMSTNEPACRTNWSLGNTHSHTWNYHKWLLPVVERLGWRLLFGESKWKKRVYIYNYHYTWHFSYIYVYVGSVLAGTVYMGFYNVSGSL